LRGEAMSNKPDKKVKSAKKAKKKTVNFNNFKVDFDLNLNKSFNTNDLLKKKFNIMRYCLALDLKDDPQLIAAYDEYHQSVWPEIIESIKSSGITHLEIYRDANRLFMMMETSVEFSFEQKAMMDASNDIVQQWEKTMWEYQQALPISKPGEKWMLMQKIFTL
jgi:L-rhamnose mutarotase